MTQEYDDVIIVDKTDTIIGHKQLPEAIKAHDIMRVVRIFVFNSKGEILLQKRSEYVLAPGLFGESAAGHVDVGENYLNAAYRELQEELGVEAELSQVCHYFYEEKIVDHSVRRFNVIYTAQHDGPFTIDPEEVAYVEFVSESELKQRIQENTHSFPEGFVYAYNQYKKAIHKG